MQRSRTRPASGCSSRTRGPGGRRPAASASHSGSSACAATSSLVGLLIGGAPALITARPPSVQKSLGNEENISSVSPRSNARLIRSRPDLDDLVGQAKVVEPLPEFSELLFLASLQLLRRFLVAAAPSVALGEERGYRQARVRYSGHGRLPSSHNDMGMQWFIEGSQILARGNRSALTWINTASRKSE